MAITLGEIAVRLVANTGEYISGFSSAGVATKRFRADLSEHIGAVGNVLERGLAQFGEFGETIGRTLGSATSAASQAVLSFGRLGGSMGTIVGVGAGVAAGLLAAEAGIIGIALHAAEGAAKLGEMSEKAGVSTQTFAGLALAGKGVGVESETLVKALGFMGSNAVKAAIAADFSKTSFGRLGIQVKDTAGQMKDGGQLFLEVVGKISSLPTSEQGFFVKQIFGRGGLEILPLINKGVDAISEKMELASKFGLGDPQTVAAARQFKETVDEIKAAFEGVALLLAKDLLPSLQVIAQEVSAAFKGGGAKEFIDDIAQVVRYTLAVGAALIDLAKIAFELGQSLNPFSTSHFDKGAGAGAKLYDAIKSGSGSAIKDALKESAGFIFKPEVDFANTFKDVHDILDAKTPTIAPARKISPFQPDLTPAKEDTTLARVKERIAALNQEQADWANTAAAATEAETLISKAVQKGNEAFGKLKTEAARDKTGAAEKFVAQQEAQIKAAAASVFYDQTVVKTNEELDKQADTLTQTDKAAIALGAAYKQGGEAIAGAALDKQFAKEAAAVAELSGVRNVAALTAKLERNEALARKVASDELIASLTKESSELAILAPFVDALSLSYLKNEDAVRSARIELEAQKFAQAELAKGVNVNAATVDVTGSNGVRETITLLEQKRRILTEADAEAYRGALAQEAAQFNISTQYDNQILKLQRIKDLMQQQGVSTLGVEAQIFDEQNRLIHQWDEWALKVGTFKQKFQAVMGELIIQGRNAGQAIAGAFLTAVDGVETSLAKLLTGQKADFKAVFQNLAESVTKAKIQEGVGKLAEHFGLRIPGLGTKADGSDSNPFYVILKGAGAPASVPFGRSNPFGGFGIGSDANPDQHSDIGGFFSGIAHLFGGFHASGGNIPSGKWGITGEQGPEITMGPASIIPAGQTYNITHNHNYPTAGSRDLFGRTQKQNQARQMRNSRMAYGF